MSIGVPEKIHLAADARNVQERLDMSNADKKTLITRILIARSIRLNCITFAMRHIHAIARHISGCFFLLFFYHLTVVGTLKKRLSETFSLTFIQRIFCWRSFVD